MDRPLKSAMKKKAPESSTEPNKLDVDEIDRSDPVAWEKAANAALTAAKRECERHPNDEQRKRRYKYHSAVLYRALTLPEGGSQ